MVDETPAQKTSFRSLWLDLGNVLVHFDPPRLWKQIGATLNISPEDARNRLQKDDLQWRYEKGLIETDSFLAALSGETVPKAELREKLCDSFCHIFTLNKNMLQWALDQKIMFGTQLVLVSNSNPLHIDFVTKTFGVINHFDVLSISYRIKSMKPERDFFVRTAALAGMPTGDTLYIDDLSDNIQAGSDFGLKSYLFKDFETFKNDLGAKSP